MERVQEVIRHEGTTRFPLASGVIHGLINLRGRIVTVVDLRTRLGLPPREPGRDPMHLVIRAEGGAVSLLVDEIADVVDVDEADWERRPSTVQGVAADVIAGAYKISGRLLLELDTARAIDPTSCGVRAARA